MDAEAPATAAADTLEQREGGRTTINHSGDETKDNRNEKDNEINTSVDGDDVDVPEGKEVQGTEETSGKEAGSMEDDEVKETAPVEQVAPVTDNDIESEATPRDTAISDLGHLALKTSPRMEATVSEDIESVEKAELGDDDDNEYDEEEEEEEVPASTIAITEDETNSITKQKVSVSETVPEKEDDSGAITEGSANNVDEEADSTRGRPETKDSAKSETSTTSASERKGSPLLTLSGIDNIVDFENLSQFDLAGSDVVRILQNNIKNLNKSHVGRRWGSILKRQQKVVDTLITKYQTEKNPDSVKKRDKVAFVLGVTDMWVTALLVGAMPEFIPWVYLVKAVVLLAIRLMVYKKKRWHYFMFDMCYFVNAIMMICLIFPSVHPNLWLATWGLANGPVLLAITAWRNSLVFHSLDKVTSLLIHLDPPLTSYVIRYSLPQLLKNREHRDGSKVLSFLIPEHFMKLANTEASMESIVFISLVTYIFWQACYWVFVWTLKAENIRNGYATSTTWMLSDRKSIIYQVSKNFSQSSRPYVFMLIQLVYTMISLFPAYLTYKSKTFHLFFIATSVFMATWNGANYYFEVFSRTYVDKLEKLRAEMGRMSERGVPKPDDSATVTPSADNAGVPTKTTSIQLPTDVPNPELRNRTKTEATTTTTTTTEHDDDSHEYSEALRTD